MFSNQIIMRYLKSCPKFFKISLFIRKIKKGKVDKKAVIKIIAKWTCVVKIE